MVEVPDEGKMEMTDGRPTWYDCNPFIKTQCHAEQPIRAVAFNPRSAMFATAASDLVRTFPHYPLASSLRRRRSFEKLTAHDHLSVVLSQAFWLPNKDLIVQPAI